MREIVNQADTDILVQKIEILLKNQESAPGKGQVVESVSDVVKVPGVLEFPGLKEKPEYSESDLESRIIDHLQKFLMKKGKGFNFVGRQVRFTFDEDHFAVLRLLMVELTLQNMNCTYRIKSFYRKS